MPIILDGTAGIDNDATDLSYTGTLTGGTGVVNLGSGQVYKDASGNVGIGTSSPAGKFNVSGSVANDLTTFSTADAATTVLNNANGVATGRASKILFRNSGFNLSGIAGVYTGFNGAGDLAGALAFGTQTNAAGGVAERARIDSSGNLLVGTTSATPNPGVSITPAGNITAGNSAGGSGFEFATFRRSAVQIGSITQSGTTAVSYNTSSDYRLKHDINPMTGALARVAALKPCTYKWNADDSGGEGFIAHELQEVCPSAVTGEKDAVNEDGSIKPQGIDTSFLTATLTAAIQELKAINDAQAQTIESLTARVVALEQP